MYVCVEAVSKQDSAKGISYEQFVAYLRGDPDKDRFRGMPSQISLCLSRSASLSLYASLSLSMPLSLSLPIM